MASKYVVFVLLVDFEISFRPHKGFWPHSFFWWFPSLWCHHYFHFFKHVAEAKFCAGRKTCERKKRSLQFGTAAGYKKWIPHLGGTAFFSVQFSSFVENPPPWVPCAASGVSEYIYIWNEQHVACSVFNLPLCENTPTLSRNTTIKQKQSQQGDKRIQSGVRFHQFAFLCCDAGLSLQWISSWRSMMKQKGRNHEEVMSGWKKYRH